MSRKAPCDIEQSIPGKYQNILLGDTPGLGICSPRTDIQIPVYLSNRSPLIGIKRTLNSIRLSHANKFYLSWFLLLETLSEWMKRNEERKVFRDRVWEWWVSRPWRKSKALELLRLLFSVDVDAQMPIILLIAMRGNTHWAERIRKRPMMFPLHIHTEWPIKVLNPIVDLHSLAYRTHQAKKRKA